MMKYKKQLLLVLLLFLLGPLFGATGESRLFAEAEKIYRGGNYSLALESYDRFMEDYPLSDLVPDVQYRRAVCLFRLGEYQASLDVLKKIGSRYPSTRYLSYVSFWAGLSLYHLNEYERALDNLEAFLSRDSEAAMMGQAYFYKGMCEALLGLNQEAEASFQLMLEKGAEDNLKTQADLSLLYIYLKTNRFEDLFRLSKGLEAYTLSSEQNDRLLYYKAEAFWKSEQKDKADALFRQLFDADPVLASSALRRSFAYAKEKEDLAEMEALLQQAEMRFAASPEYMRDFWIYSGVEHFKQKNWSLADYFFTRVWNLRRDSLPAAAAVLYGAEAKLKLKQTNQAAAMLKEYLDLSGAVNGPVMLRLADVYLMDKEYDKSRALYEEYLSSADIVDKKVFEASYYLSYIAYAQGNYSLALKLLTQSLQSGNDRGKYLGENLKLQIVLYKKTKQPAKALELLRQYLALFPKDLSMGVDMVKSLYEAGDYAGAVSESLRIFDARRSLAQQSPRDFYTLCYFQGLSYVGLKDYARAKEALGLFDEEAARRYGLEDLEPYARFYEAWSLLRKLDYQKSGEVFYSLYNRVKIQDLGEKALYYAAWSCFSARDYQKAYEYYAELADKGKDRVLAHEARFFQAKSLVNQNKDDQAMAVYKMILSQREKGDFSDDALFDYANLLVKKKFVKEPANEFLKLTIEYPDSPLVEEALYRRAEVFFLGALYKEARDAFYDYRVKYPGGKLMDSALYWGGETAFALDEKFGAILLWKIIIKDYPKSPFRANALKKTAEIYKETGDYSSALDLYQDLISAYPVEAAALDAQAKAEELRFLIQGFGKREAEISALVRQNRGVATSEGRKATLDLVQLYLYDEDLNKADKALKLIQDVVSHSEDKINMAQAQYFLGEYYFRKDDYIKAGNQFLQAALTNPANRDLMALSLYKAAEMMKLANKPNDVRVLVDRLEKNFPASQWLIEGKKLLEDLK
ncbi:MAG: tetratricopeptide repeat protein [Spirochaetales bacterium]|nr:tetratricopeptide repeat protein [Spirochaetales bacterium]